MKKLPVLLVLVALLVACGQGEARLPAVSSAPSPIPSAEPTALPGIAPPAVPTSAPPKVTLTVGTGNRVLVENRAPVVTPTAAISSAAPTPAVALPSAWQVLSELGNTFSHLAAGPTGAVWAVGADGLFQFDGQGWQAFPLPDGLAEEKASTDLRSPSIYGLSDLAVAPNGDVWIGTVEEGVYRFENGVWTHHTPAEGLPGHGARRLGIDAQNHLWAMGPDSLSRFDGQTWQLTPIGDSERMPKELADLAVTPGGEVWLSVPTDGLYQFDGEGWVRHSQETRKDWNGVVAEISMHVAVGPGGQVWLGTDGGWLRWAERGWQGLDVSIPAPFAYPRAVDSSGGTWGIVTPSCYFCRLPNLNDNGVVYVGSDVACRFTAADGLGGSPLDPPPSFDDYETPRPDEVWDIAVAADGSVWFITQGQITVFRPQGPVCSYASPQAVRTPAPTSQSP